MSTLNSFFCGLPVSKKKSKRKSSQIYDNNCSNMSDPNNNSNKVNHEKTDMESNDDSQISQLFQKETTVRSLSVKNKKVSDEDKENSGTEGSQDGRQPFLSRPLKFLSIHFLYKNPIGRQLTRENFKNKADICRAVQNQNLMLEPSQADYVKSIPNALSWRGLLLQGYLVSAKALRQIEKFPIRNDDVWLCTYPKSGTTWTEEILSLIVTDANVKKTNKTLLPERVPHLEVGPPIGYMNWLRNRPSPRLVATHLPIGHIPAQLRQCKTNAKIIYVVRNPKDNAVSYYHHHRMSTFLGKYNGSWNNFVQLFADGHLVYGDWFEHVRGYWELAREFPEQVLFISYEELKVNLPKMIETIANFINHPLTSEQIDLIARQCTFEKMKNNAMVNRENLPVGDLFDMSEVKFMRKGIIGDWKNHFSEEENRLFDETYTDKLNEIGLKIAYNHEQALDMFSKSATRIVDDEENNDESVTESSGFSSESSEISE